VGVLLEKSKEDLLDLRNFGRKSWEEVQEKLIKMGLVEKPQIDEEKLEDSDQIPSEEKSPEDAEKEEMKKKLKERFVVREEK
jgi:DNA-directed RNA polymerase subunit alpha